MHFRRATTALLCLLALPCMLAAQHPSLDLGAEVRGLQQWEPPVGGGAGASPALVRSRLGAEAIFGAWSRVIVELQHVRGFGDPFREGDSIPEALGLHQGYLELTAGLAGLDGRVRVGRQEIALGNERHVGRDEWSPAGRSFDAVHARIERPGGWWDATAFVGRMTDPLRDREPRFDPEPREHLLIAGYFGTPVADAFVIHDDGVVDDFGRTFDRTTAGVHLRLPEWVRLRAEVEWAYQFGTLTSRSEFGNLRGSVESPLRASLLGLRLGLPDPIPRMEYLGVGLDRLSGQVENHDTHTAFQPLYGSGHPFYGQRDLFHARPFAPGEARQAGLVDAFMEARWPVEGAGTLEVAAHRFLAEADRSFTEDRELGWELDMRMPVQMGDLAELEMGYSLYHVGYGETRHWAYAQLTLGL